MGSAEDEYERIIARLRREFLDNCDDRLSAVDAALDDLAEARATWLDCSPIIRREIHSLKGMGGSFGYPLLSVLAHRLENYMADDRLDKSHSGAIQTFLDRMRQVLEQPPNSDTEASAEMLRSLPMRAPAGFSQQSVRNVEVLMVMPRDTQHRIVERELHSCGFRVMTIERPLDAVPMALHSKPDLVVTTTVLDELSGVELAGVLAAIKATRSIPFILLTSYDRSDPRLAELPPGCEVVSKHGKALEGLSEALMKFSLF